MAASATAALAQEAAEQSADPAFVPPDQASKTGRQTKQPGGAKKARQRQRKQVSPCDQQDTTAAQVLRQLGCQNLQTGFSEVCVSSAGAARCSLVAGRM